MFSLLIYSWLLICFLSRKQSVRFSLKLSSRRLVGSNAVSSGSSCYWPRSRLSICFSRLHMLGWSGSPPTHWLPFSRNRHSWILALGLFICHFCSRIRTILWSQVYLPSSDLYGCTQAWGNLRCLRDQGGWKHRTPSFYCSLPRVAIQGKVRNSGRNRMTSDQCNLSAWAHWRVQSSQCLRHWPGWTCPSFGRGRRERPH